MYVKNIPIFWFPYLYQSLNNQFLFLISPGYNSNYGEYIVSDIGFPVFDHFDAILHLNAYSLRGPALGIDINYNLGEQEQQDTVKAKTFFISDKGANINQTSLGRPPIDAGRYRLSYESRTFLASDTSLVLEVNKFSDDFLMEDFFPYEFQVDPQPQTYVELIKQGDAYALSLFARYQVNDFFQTTEKLPELSWEVVRTPLFNSPIFYEATTTAGWYQVAQPVGTFFNPTLNPDYSSFRFDTFHQLTFPHTYFGFLSLVPRVGFRTTYYSRGGDVIVGNPAAGIPFGSVAYEAGRNPICRKRRFRYLVQTVSHLRRRSGPLVGTRRSAACHPALRRLLLGLNPKYWTGEDPPVRPIYHEYLFASHRFPAIYRYRFNRSRIGSAAGSTQQIRNPSR